MTTNPYNSDVFTTLILQQKKIQLSGDTKDIGPYAQTLT